MDGVELIAAERARQQRVEEFDLAHDDQHTLAELTLAGFSYASLAASQVRLAGGCVKERLPVYWPWDASWYKPSPDPIRNLAKAGALLAAEIDRLQRKAGRTAKSSSDAGPSLPPAMQEMVEVVFLDGIEEWREVFLCECGKKAYCLDPGDGLPTHLADDEQTKMLTRAEAALL